MGFPEVPFPVAQLFGAMLNALKIWPELHSRAIRCDLNFLCGKKHLIYHDVSRISTQDTGEWLADRFISSLNGEK